MRSPDNKQLKPSGYYECSKCGSGIEVHVRMFDAPICTSHGIMNLAKKPKNFGKE